MTWTPVTYDPELNLIFVTTGNPQPVIAHANRAGANLFTGSIVALNADTGAMVWYFQSSPHDTHDWDSTQTAVVFDGRSMASRGSSSRRPRATAISSCSTGPTARPSSRRSTSRRTGRPATTRTASRFRIPRRCRTIDGALVSPNQGGGTNWQSPTFSPRTGLFYVNAVARVQRVLPLRSERQPGGVGRHRSRRLLGVDAAGDRLSDRQDPVDAIPGRAAALTGLLSHRRQRVVHRRLRRPRSAQRDNRRRALALPHRQVTNAPITYELDGFQYVVVASGGTVFAFVLN